MKYSLFYILGLFCLVFALSAFAAEKRIYLHTDHLGSVIAATEASGQLAWREEYEPYGFKRLTPTEAEDQRLWYTGHAHDEAMSLSYFGARWYDPEAGRFLAVDPLDWMEYNAVHSFNRYAYANNNPHKYIDPDGREPHRWADGNYSDNDGQENPGRWERIRKAYGQVGGGIAEGWSSHPVALIGAGIGLRGLLASKGIPFGFKSASDFAQFGKTLNSGLADAGFGGTRALLQGSTVTGKSFRTGKAFDVGRVSDFDIALAGSQIFARAQQFGIGLRSGGMRTGPLTASQVRQLGLGSMQSTLSKLAGRPVNFMIYRDAGAAAFRAPSVRF